MRIAVNASIVDPFISGLGVYTVNVLRELDKLHEDLVVYTSYPKACGLHSSKIRKISPKVQPLRGRSGHFQRLIWTQASLPLRLLADKASVLFSPLPEGTLLTLTPQVIVVHDILPLYFPMEFPRQQHYFRHFVPAILKRARAVIAVSETTKRDIMTSYSMPSHRVHVVANGCDHSCYRFGTDTAKVKRKYDLEAYFLYVGNLLPHKNLGRLLKAFALIAARFPHKMVIVGRKDPRYHPALERESRALGLEKKVFFLDYVGSDELPALYGGAEAFILPSLYEGFGLTVLEAMACGTPVIASHAGSLPEVAGNAAILVDPYRIQGMAEAMEAVLKHPEMRQDMSRRGLERAQDFSWGRTARMSLEILRQEAD